MGAAQAAPGRGAPTRPGSCAPVAGRGGGSGGVSMGNEAVSAERGRWAQGRAGDRASREAGRRCPGTPRKLTQYVRGNVHLRLSLMSVQNRRDELGSSCEYLLHFQHRSRTSASFSRKVCNRPYDLADHVGVESGTRDSNECHRAPACRANGSDKFENLLESQRQLLQVRSQHNAAHAQNCKAAPSMLDSDGRKRKTSNSMLVI